MDIAHDLFEWLGRKASMFYTEFRSRVGRRDSLLPGALAANNSNDASTSQSGTYRARRLSQNRPRRNYFIENRDSTLVTEPFLDRLLEEQALTQGDSSQPKRSGSPDSAADHEVTDPRIVSRMAVVGVGELTPLRQVATLNIYKYHQLTIKGEQRKLSVKYHVLNNWGQLLFTVSEKSSLLGRWTYGYLGERSLLFEDNAGVEVLHMERPGRFNLFCFLPSFLELAWQKVSLYSQGRLIGVISYSGKCFPEMLLEIRKDRNGHLCYEVTGLPCGGAKHWCFEDGYRVYKTEKEGYDDELVGYIRKDWPEQMPSEYEGSYTNHLGLSFEPSLSADVIVLILGAAFVLQHVIYDNWYPMWCDSWGTPRYRAKNVTVV